MKKLLLLLLLIPNLVMAYDGRMGGGSGIGGFVIIMAFLIWYNWDNIWNILGIILLVFITSILLWQSLSEGNFSIVFLLAAIFLTVKNWDKLRNIYINFFEKFKTSEQKKSESYSPTSKIPVQKSSPTVSLLIQIQKCHRDQKVITFKYGDENIIFSAHDVKNTGFLAYIIYGYCHSKKRNRELNLNAISKIKILPKVKYEAFRR